MLYPYSLPKVMCIYILWQWYSNSCQLCLIGCQYLYLTYKCASNLCADAVLFIAKGSLCAVLSYVKRNWVLTKWQWRQQPKILALCKSIMSQITHFLSPQVNVWDSEWFAQFSSVILPFHFQGLISGSPYCLPNSSYNVSLENLVMDQLIIPLLTFVFFLIICFLDILLMFRC